MKLPCWVREGGCISMRLFTTMGFAYGSLNKIPTKAATQDHKEVLELVGPGPNFSACQTPKAKLPLWGLVKLLDICHLELWFGMKGCFYLYVVSLMRHMFTSAPRLRAGTSGPEWFRFKYETSAKWVAESEIKRHVWFVQWIIVPSFAEDAMELSLMGQEWSGWL